jgi:hypothetical protein
VSDTHHQPPPSPIIAPPTKAGRSNPSFAPEARKNFFFEKKKQKTFAPGPGDVSRPEANQQKFFGYFFSKK